MINDFFHLRTEALRRKKNMKGKEKSDSKMEKSDSKKKYLDLIKIDIICKIKFLLMKDYDLLLPSD